MMSTTNDSLGLVPPSRSVVDIFIELPSSSSRQSIKSYYVHNSYAKYCATDQKRAKGIEHAPNGTERSNGTLPNIRELTCRGQRCATAVRRFQSPSGACDPWFASLFLPSSEPLPACRLLDDPDGANSLSWGRWNEITITL